MPSNCFPKALHPVSETTFRLDRLNTLDTFSAAPQNGVFFIETRLDGTSSSLIFLFDGSHAGRGNARPLGRLS